MSEKVWLPLLSPVVEPGADGRKLRAGGGGVGVKGVGAAPLHDAQTRHGGDGGICPIVIRNIGIGIAGQKIAVTHLIFQKPEENGGGLRTGESVHLGKHCHHCDRRYRQSGLRRSAAQVWSRGSSEPSRRSGRGRPARVPLFFNGEIEVGGGGVAPPEFLFHLAYKVISPVTGLVKSYLVWQAASVYQRTVLNAMDIT